MTVEPEATVVVVETPPSFVTHEELDAKLALLQRDTVDAIAPVAEIAVEAAVTAQDAQYTAEDAEARADVALEVAVDAAETAAETEAEAEPEEPAGPKAAQPRQENADTPAPKKERSYGSRLYD